MEIITIKGAPVPKPRMSRSDRWKKRPATDRYWAWVNTLKATCPIIHPASPLCLTFYLPMPKSWGAKKKKMLTGQPHTEKPDIDNLIKGVLDGLFDDDSGIWSIQASKYWEDSNGPRLEIRVRAAFVG